MTLERALAWIQDDELVEVTPKSIRLRKAIPRPERPQARRALARGAERLRGAHKVNLRGLAGSPGDRGE
jgi:hypothetical protein